MELGPPTQRGVIENSAFPSANTQELQIHPKGERIRGRVQSRNSKMNVQRPRIRSPDVPME